MEIFQPRGLKILSCNHAFDLIMFLCWSQGRNFSLVKNARLTRGWKNFHVIIPLELNSFMQKQKIVVKMWSLVGDISIHTPRNQTPDWKIGLLIGWQIKWYEVLSDRKYLPQVMNTVNKMPHHTINIIWFFTLYHNSYFVV